MLTRSKYLQRRTRRKATVVNDGAIAATLAGQQSRRSISPDRELAARQRRTQIERYRNLVRAGTNQTNAARQVGFSRSSAFRWIKRLEAGGLAALAPQAHGRRPLADQCGLTADVLQQLCRAVVAVGNIPRGFRMFARSPQCPPPLARIIRRSPSIPGSLRSLVALQPIQFGGLQAGNQIVLVQGGRA